MRLLALLSALILWHAADVTGNWKVVAQREGGEVSATLSLKSDGSAISGTMTTSEGDVLTLTEVKLTENELRFKIPTDNGAFEVSVTVDQDVMKGTYKDPAGTTNSLTASRAK